MKLYGTNQNSACLEAFKRLDEAGVSYEFIDITASEENLREFLNLRDKEERFLDVKKCGDIGIPCYLLDDMTVTFDTDRVIGIKKTSWNQSVTGVLIKDGRVLLGRHTYGSGKGKLIVPGGYLSIGETPEETVVREYLEETGVTVRPVSIIGIRFNSKDWYVAFLLEYLSGEACCGDEENSEMIWLDTDEALARDDVPELTKYLIRAALSGHDALPLTDFKNSYGIYGEPTLYARI